MAGTNLGQCKICNSPLRVELDAAYFDSTLTQNQIAERIGCNRKTVYRHIKNHLAGELTRAGKGEPPTLLGAIAAVESETMNVLREAAKKKNHDMVLKAADRRIAQIKLIADLTGQYQERKPNEEVEKRKAEQLERVIDTMLVRAKEAAINITPAQAIAELLQFEPEILKFLPLTKYGSSILPPPTTIVN